jgi:hypothetical protein
MIQAFSDSDLLSHTKYLVREEARATQEVLRHLREIERRGIHLRSGFASLHEFAVTELGYSDGAAARRVSAMRLIQAVPEAETMLTRGSLTLETMSTLQRHLVKTKADQTLKREIVSGAQFQSKRALEKSLGISQPQAIYLETETLELLGKLKAELGTISLDQIIRSLASQALSRMEKKEKVKTEVKVRKAAKANKESVFLTKNQAQAETKNQAQAETKNQAQAETKNQAQAETKTQVQEVTKTPTNAAPPAEQDATASSIKAHLATPPAELKPATTSRPRTHHFAQDVNRPTFTRFVPRVIKRHVIRRDGARCTYRDRASLRRCSETRFLQFDHIHPFALGGETSATNLRLFCANHNRARVRSS